MATPNRFLKMVFFFKFKNESRIFSGKRIIAKNAGSTGSSCCFRVLPSEFIVICVFQNKKKKKSKVFFMFSLFSDQKTVFKKVKQTNLSSMARGANYVNTFIYVNTFFGG